jgi:hypothetical protein
MAPFREMVNELKTRHPKLLVYDPTKIYCPDRCVITHDGKSLYKDNHHLSDYGASLVTPGLIELMDAATQSTAYRQRSRFETDFSLR